MAEVSGRTWVLKNGAGHALIAGKTDGTMALTHTPIDCTNSDSGNRRELLAGVHAVTFTLSGHAEEGDAGFDALWTAWDGPGTALQFRWTTPVGATFTGTGYITTLTYSGAHAGVFSFSLTVEISGTLIKA